MCVSSCREVLREEQRGRSRNVAFTFGQLVSHALPSSLRRRGAFVTVVIL